MRAFFYRTDTEDGFYVELSINIDGIEKPSYFATLKDLAGTIHQEEEIDKELVTALIVSKTI